jgi:TrmH family RNA methyltransferase
LITSPNNEKLKLVRKLAERKHREREELFVTEGEDLFATGIAAGAEPRFALCAAGSGLDGEETDPELLAGASALGSGTRLIAVWPRCFAEELGEPCLYLHGVADPGNVGTILRSAEALLGATVVLGPGCADPHGPKAVRASMGAIFARPPARAAVDATPTPRAGLVAHGGAGPERLAGAATLCLGAEREGLPAQVAAACDVLVTIPLRAGATESLNVAAAAAIVLQGISSRASGATQSKAAKGDPDG